MFGQNGPHILAFNILGNNYTNIDKYGYKNNSKNI